MKPINVFLLVLIALSGSYYRQNVQHKETGEKLMNKLYEIEQRVIPDELINDIPAYSEKQMIKIKIIHECQQLIYEEFKLWK
jgi:hypothetical protein